MLLQLGPGLGGAQVGQLQLHIPPSPEFIDLRLEGQVYPIARRCPDLCSGSGEEDGVQHPLSFAYPQLQMAAAAHISGGENLYPRSGKIPGRAIPAP